MASTLKSIPTYFKHPNGMWSHELPPSPSYGGATNTLLWGENHGINYPPMDLNGQDQLDFQLAQTLSASSLSSSSFLEPFQMDVLEQLQPTLLDYNDVYASNQARSVDASYDQPNLYENREQEGGNLGAMLRFAPVYPATNGDNNWLATQSDSATPTSIESIKVGRYSVEERKDRILRYLKKRNHRNFNKTIKYACRKTLADRRTRVRGRFAKNHEELDVKIVNNSTCLDHKEKLPYSYDFTDQMKQDGDDWLQEAIASLVYMPYIPPAGWHGEVVLK
ncbi:hypothetical protein Ancab_001580 [Ancistrocladus abbreviatus]